VGDELIYIFYSYNGITVCPVGCIQSLVLLVRQALGTKCSFIRRHDISINSIDSCAQERRWGMSNQDWRERRDISAKEWVLYDHYRAFPAGWDAGRADALKDEVVFGLIRAIRNARACLPDELARPCGYLDDALTAFAKATEENK